MQNIYKNFKFKLPEGISVWLDMQDSIYVEIREIPEDWKIQFYTTGAEYNDHSPVLDIWNEEDRITLAGEPEKFSHNGFDCCNLMYEYKDEEYCEYRLRIDADEQNRTLVLLLGNKKNAAKTGGNKVMWNLLQSIQKNK